MQAVVALGTWHLQGLTDLIDGLMTHEDKLTGNKRYETAEDLLPTQILLKLTNHQFSLLDSYPNFGACLKAPDRDEPVPMPKEDRAIPLL